MSNRKYFSTFHWAEEREMTAYEGVAHIVEKEKTIILCRIMHRSQNGTWLGKGRKSCSIFYCHVYPHIMMVALEVTIMALCS